MVDLVYSSQHRPNDLYLPAQHIWSVTPLYTLPDRGIIHQLCFAKTHSRMKDNEFPSACSCPVHWSLVHDQLIIITLLLQHCLSVCLSVCPSVCRQAYCEQGATAAAACGGDGGAMLLFGCIIMCAFCHISATINIILDVSSCQLKSITKLSQKYLIQFL